MLRIFSVLVVVALIGATGVQAQQDWGTDADSVITIMEAVGAIDMPGEGGLTIGGGQPLGAPMPESTTVTAVYNMDSIGTNVDTRVMKGDTLWRPYFLKNMSNGPDSLHVSAQIYFSTMDVMDVLIAVDAEGDTMINLMGTDYIGSVNGEFGMPLAEDATQIIFVGVVIPDTAVDSDTARYAIEIRDNMGTGTDDFWPMSYPAYTLAPDNGDRQVDTFMVALGMPVIHYATMSSKTTAVPGDTVMYTLAYDNDGSDSTDVAGGGQLYITQLLPKFVDYATGTFDYSQVHTGAGATAMFSDIMSPVAFAHDETWANTNPDSVAGFQVNFTGDILAHEDGEGTDTKGIVDGDIPDVDAGQITFKVIVK